MRISNAFRNLCWLSLAILHPLVSFAQSTSSLVVAQYHFAGSTQLSSDTSCAKLKQISTLPSHNDFQSAVLRKFAAIISKAIAPQANPDSAISSLQPLLDDLLESESFANFGGRTGAPLGFAIALRVDDRRAKLWESNLTQLLAVKPEKITTGGAAGLKWGSGTRAIRLVQVKDWAVIAGGEDLLTVQNQILSNLRQQGRPGPALQGKLFEANVDWVRLAPWIPTLSASHFKLARTQITISGQGDNLRTTVNVHYPEALGWKSKPWRIPTEIIRDPVISFTAGQNFGVLLQPVKGVSQLQPNPLAEEFFVWASGDIALQTSFAIPVTGSSNLLRGLSTQIPSLFNPKLQESHDGEIRWFADKQELDWQGLPIVVPYLKSSKDKTGDYLVGGFFPLATRGKPVPGELFAQFNTRNNVIYYDWELTGPRMEQWRSLAQMLPILRPAATKRPPGAKRPALAAKGTAPTKSPRAAREAWLTAVSPLLGNTITEITATGPNDVTVVRKSHIGFTGLELVLLSDWLIRQ